MPHGHCYQWQPTLVALHLTSDLVTFAAYTSIPFLLLRLYRERGDLPFRGLFAAFVGFIAFCGLTHLLEAWTIYRPLYWVSGSVKAATAVASAMTAILLARNMPAILAIPTREAVLRAHARLEASERRFRTAITQMQDGLAILEPIRDPSGQPVDFTIRHLNAAMAGMLGASDPPNDGAVVLSEVGGVRYLLDAIVGMLEGGLETRTVHSPHEGGPRLQHEVVDLRSEGVLVVTRDRTRELEAASTRERLARLVEGSPDAIVSVDPEGTVESWNDSAETLLHTSAGDAVGAPLSEVIGFEGESLDAVFAVLEGDGTRTEEDRLVPSGTPVSMRVSRLEVGDQSDSAVVVLRDLTDSRQAAELRRSLALQEVLVREIHHRVKNSLQVVSSLLNLSVGDMDAGRIDPRSALADSRDRVMAIALLHEQLHSGEDLTELRMGDYLDQLTRRLFRSYARPGQTIRIDAGDVVLPMTEAMPLALVLHELVTNALTHGLGTSPGEIAVRLAAGSDRYELAVFDPGPPFDEDLARRGSRLGLQLVESLVGQLGGSWAIQRVEEAKQVVVRWPLAARKLS